MTSNDRRKTLIRAYAAAEGISYTDAMRRLDNQPPASPDEGPGSTPPLSGNTWTIRFEARPDLSLPLDLRVTDGGLIGAQEFWRGEKFQIIGLSESPYAAGITVAWDALVDDTSDPADDGGLDRAVGLYPVISTLEGRWSTWQDRVREIVFTTGLDRTAQRGEAVTARFIPDGDGPRFRLRVEEFLAALPDATLDDLAAADWVTASHESGLLFRAAVARRDPDALAAADWVDAVCDADPDLWGEMEPFRLAIDPAQARRWRERTRLYPHPGH